MVGLDSKLTRYSIPGDIELGTSPPLPSPHHHCSKFSRIPATSIMAITVLLSSINPAAMNSRLRRSGLQFSSRDLLMSMPDFRNLSPNLASSSGDKVVSLLYRSHHMLSGSRSSSGSFGHSAKSSSGIFSTDFNSRGGLTRWEHFPMQ